MLIKAYNLVGIIKRYYKLICQAYSIITTKILNISKDIALQIAFKAINNIVRLNKIILILLIYNIYSQITKYNLLLLLVAQ